MLCTALPGSLYAHNWKYKFKEKDKNKHFAKGSVLFALQNTSALGGNDVLILCHTAFLKRRKRFNRDSCQVRCMAQECCIHRNTVTFVKNSLIY